MAILLPDPSLQDLKLKFHESILVTPSQQTERRSFFLSNIDQLLMYPVPLVSFFNAHPYYVPDIVDEMLKTALAKLLVHYDFMAGRFKLNEESNRLEIDCNAKGVGFVVASSEYSLLDLGDLTRPNVGFYQLVTHTLGPESDDDPLFFCQVTSFKCGGFAIGMSLNHSLLDGMGTSTFMENLASQTFDNKPLSKIPLHDRHLLDARSPPKISFPLTEFLDADGSSSGFEHVEFDELDHRVFKLTPSIINNLKQRAINKVGDGDLQPIGRGTNHPFSSFMVTTSVIWLCKTLSSSRPDSTLLTVVEIRSRLNPPLSPSYSGNAVMVSSTTVERGDIGSLDFSDLVKMVAAGVARTSDEEYVRSVIDWLEVNKIVPNGDYFVSSLKTTKQGVEEVVFPWGKSVFSGPVVSHMSNNVCWVYQDEDGSLNAMVSLPIDEMKRFETHFRSFLGLSSDPQQPLSRL